jgi:carboxyl-terminal processing protease
MRKSGFSIWMVFFLATAIGGAAMSGAARSAPAPAANNQIYKRLDLFGRVLEQIRSGYVDQTDDEKLIEGAINGMVNSLDPHSSYLSPRQLKDMEVETRGEFGGLGVEVSMEGGVVEITSLIKDAPAEKAGLRMGDRITHLDGKDIRGLPLDKAVEKMRGQVKTTLHLTIERPGRPDPFEVTVIRDVVRINPVESNAEDDVAYIRIKSFSEQTFDGLRKSVVKLTAEIGPRLKGFIIDLRNNPGGLLDQAIAVSDAFLDKGAIVITRGRNPTETQRSNARPGDLTEGRPIVVLINGGSASASEIVAGALQDHKRAQIVGTRSFGKGSVQTIIPLDQNGALRLTTARYFTPSGRSIQAKGIEPDFVVEEDLPEDLRGRKQAPIGEASLPGHLKNDPNLREESGSSGYVPKEKGKDKQLIYALNLLRGVKSAERNIREQAAAGRN